MPSFINIFTPSYTTLPYKKDIINSCSVILWLIIISLLITVKNTSICSFDLSGVRCVEMSSVQAGGQGSAYWVEKWTSLIAYFTV